MDRPPPGGRWLGLGPLQHSSGGKERLGRISKRGDGYLRRLLIHGARTVLRWRRRGIGLTASPWIAGLLERRPVNVTTVALANKNARIIPRWSADRRPFGSRIDRLLAVDGR